MQHGGSAAGYMQLLVYAAFLYQVQREVNKDEGRAYWHARGHASIAEGPSAVLHAAWHDKIHWSQHFQALLWVRWQCR